MTKTNPSAPAGIAKLSFEAALAELEKIVQALEAGEVPLAESVKLYERGTHLTSHCQGLLDDAQTRIDRIGIDSGGAVTSAPAGEPADDNVPL